MSLKTIEKVYVRREPKFDVLHYKDVSGRLEELQEWVGDEERVITLDSNVYLTDRLLTEDLVIIKDNDGVIEIMSKDVFDEYFELPSNPVAEFSSEVFREMRRIRRGGR